MSLHEEDTVEFPVVRPAESKLFAADAEPVRFQFGALSLTGKVREGNEDHFAIVERTRSQRLLHSNIPTDDALNVEDHAYFMVVADGIGGAAFGEFASRLAIRAVWDWASRAASWVMKLRDLDAQQVQERVAAFAQLIQQEMREHMEADPRLEGMGTTWTSAYLMGWDALIAHVGDSRAYLCRDGAARQITRDHTFAEELVAKGAAPEDVQGFRNVLMRYLGGQFDDDRVEVDVELVRLRDGDRLLLCSDGLSDVLDDREIAGLIDRHADPQDACQTLADLALERGGPDNITVVLASVEKAAAAGT